MTKIHLALLPCASAVVVVESTPSVSQFVGVCEPNWDIGILVIFSGILGYYLSQIGILGYPHQRI